MTEQELVERLRADIRSHELTGNGGMKRVENVREAADTITRLVEKRDKLVAALRMASCPRPANHRPDEFDIGDCCDAGECGCFARRALEKTK